MNVVVHGGLHDAELAALGLSPRDVLDLSANLHPSGPHPAVIAAARNADVTRYPEPDARALRDAIAKRAGLAPEQVLVTPGATAAIHLVARALLRPGDRCAVFTPTFGEYAAAARIAGAELLEYRAQPPAFDPLAAIGALAGASGASAGRSLARYHKQPERAPLAPLTFLCNPNNPTGSYLDRTSVDSLVDQITPNADHAGALCLDVAYSPFVDDAWDADALVRAGAPVIVIHSLTKLHAIPGLRAGHITGPAPLIARIAEQQHAWAVGAPELAAGLAALTVEPEQRRAAAPSAAVREQLRAALTTAGAAVAPGRANFLLTEVGDAPSFRARLLKRGFAVRDCTSFGLPGWVRIAVPPEHALAPLISALHATFAETP